MADILWIYAPNFIWIGHLSGCKLSKMIWEYFYSGFFWGGGGGGGGGGGKDPIVNYK